MFTPEEDELLTRVIEQNGLTCWEKISQHLPGRSARQCRDRWTNYLSLGGKPVPWTQQEDIILIQKVAEIGTKWTTIAKCLPGRSENHVKNRWYSGLKRKINIIPGSGEAPIAQIQALQASPVQPSPPKQENINEFLSKYTNPMKQISPPQTEVKVNIKTEAPKIIQPSRRIMFQKTPSPIVKFWDHSSLIAEESSYLHGESTQSGNMFWTF